MSIPFRVASEIAELGTAGYLKVEEQNKYYRGALFLINCRGEPIEFTCSDVEISNIFLWNEQEVRLSAVSRIIISLFELCPYSPRLIFCLGTDIPAEIFCEYINVAIPVCRIMNSNKIYPVHEEEIRYTDEHHPGIQLLWYPQLPSSNSLESKLYAKLSSAGLLLEPFQRIIKGLAEVYDKSE